MSALKVDPNDVQTHNSLAAAYGQTWQTDAAIAELGRALSIDPNNAEAHFGLGIAYAERGQLDAAIRGFEGALRVNPNDAKVRDALRLAQEQRLTGNSARERANMGNHYLAKDRSMLPYAYLRKL